MFRKATEQVARADAWISLGTWLKDNWPGIVTMLASLGVGTYAASGIEAVNQLGWGAWVFLGSFFAVLIGLAAALLAHAIGYWRGGFTPSAGTKSQPDYPAHASAMMMW
jgi:hypothetical protein